MSLQGLTLAGRGLAERLMTDACTIKRPGVGDPVYDAATDTTTPPAATTVYDDPTTAGAGGKCRVKPAATQDLTAEAGEALVGARRYVVSVPMAVTDVRRGDLVEVVASAQDPALVGTRFRVLGALKGSQTTARRLACEEVTG